MLTTPLTTAPVPMGVVPSKKLTVPVGVVPAASRGEGRGEDGGVVEEDGVDRAGERDVDDVENGLEDGVGGAGLVAGVAGVDRGEGVDAGEREAGDEGWRRRR